MAQRLKTDWILFVTVLVMVSFGAADHLQRIVHQRQNGSAVSVELVFRLPPARVGGALRHRDDGAQENFTTANYQNAGGGIQRDRHCAAAAAGGVLCSIPAATAGCACVTWAVQPSELAKPALVIFLAFFVTWRARAINNPRHTLLPAALAVGLVIFAVVRGDLGTAVVLGAVASIVFFVAGLEWRYVAIVGIVALIGVLISIWNDPYRLERVVKFFDPQFKIVTRLDPQRTHQIAARKIADHRAIPTTSSRNRKSPSAPAGRWGSD